MPVDSVSTIAFPSTIGTCLGRIFLSDSVAGVAISNLPPPYKSSIEELSKNIQTKQAEDAEALLQEFFKLFSNDEVERAFRDRMMGLAVTVTSLQKDFDSVANSVKNFDARHYHDREWQPIPPLIISWDALHERYGNIIRDSRQFSFSIQERLSTFYKVVLPKLRESDASPQEKLDSLESFLGIGDDQNSKDISEKLMQDENEAERIAREFEDLKAKIESFSSILKKRLNDAQEGVHQDIIGLEDNLNNLKRILDDLTSRTLEIAFNIGDIRRRIDETEKELEITHEKWSQATGREKEIPAFMGDVAKQVSASSNDILTQLANLISIYSHIRTDAQSAREHLESAINSDAPLLFREGSIDLTIALYEKLELALAMYERGFEG